MSTTASIEFDHTHEELYVNHDGYPSAMVDYLEELVEKAKKIDDWIDELDLILLEEVREGKLSRHSSGVIEYKYKITDEGEVLYKDFDDISGNDWSEVEWKQYKE